MDPNESLRKRSSRRFDQCDETCTTDCGHCKGRRFGPHAEPIVPLAAEVRLPVTPGQTFVSLLDGGIHRAEYVEYRAYLYDGDYYRVARVFAADGHNAEAGAAEWPPAPAWFDQVAVEIEASVSLPTASQHDSASTSTLAQNG